MRQYAKGRLTRRIRAAVAAARGGVLALRLMPPTCIWTVYPLQTNPFGPRLNQNLPTNRPEVLAKYGVWATTPVKVMVIFFKSRLSRAGGGRAGGSRSLEHSLACAT